MELPLLMFCFRNVAQGLEFVLSQKFLLTLLQSKHSEDVDLIFPGRPFELMSQLQRPPALDWPWPGLGIGSGCGAMKGSSLSQRSLIQRENLCLAVGFLCPQQFPPGVRSSALWQRRAEARFGRYSG